MPEEPRFSAAEVDIVLHATEDQEKVLAAVEKALGVSATDFAGEQAEGHFGNRIVLMKATVASKDAGALAAKIMSSLNRPDRQELADHIGEYSDDKGNLYLRLDKQRICQGRVSLAESDAVRVRFRPVRRYRPSGNVETYRGLLSLG
ncbi:MAG TPA: RNA-binding domain-containing protein [Nitrososphaera sp.]